MISCYETGLPYCLDPHTLNTLGADDLGGTLKLKTLAAHFRLDMEKNVSVVCVHMLYISTTEAGMYQCQARCGQGGPITRNL